LKYLRSFWGGVAASALTLIVFLVLTQAVMVRSPEMAERIFRLRWYQLDWGYFYLEFPLWPTVIVALLAFAITFGWMLRRGAART